MNFYNITDFGNIKDTNGKFLPENIFKIVAIPPQIDSAQTATIIKTAGLVTITFMGGILGSNVALTALTGACLS